MDISIQALPGARHFAFERGAWPEEALRAELKARGVVQREVDSKFYEAKRKDARNNWVCTGKTKL